MLRSQHVKTMFGVVVASCLASVAQAQWGNNGNGNSGNSNSLNPTYLTSVSGASLSSYQTTTIPLGYSFASKT